MKDGEKRYLKITLYKKKENSVKKELKVGNLYFCTNCTNQKGCFVSFTFKEIKSNYLRCNSPDK